MAYNVIMLPAAEDDYREILLYFEKQFDSRQAIQTFVKELGEALSRLVENPNIYGYSRDEGLRQRGYRKFLIGKYVALFKIDEQKKLVEIYRIYNKCMPLCNLHSGNFFGGVALSKLKYQKKSVITMRTSFSG